MLEESTGPYSLDIVSHRNFDLICKHNTLLLQGVLHDLHPLEDSLLFEPSPDDLDTEWQPMHPFCIVCGIRDSRRS